MQLWRLACGTSTIVDIRGLKVNWCRSLNLGGGTEVDFAMDRDMF